MIELEPKLEIRIVDMNTKVGEPKSHSTPEVV